MIEVCGLTKRYGSRTVVNDVTFTVQKGEIVGLLGPNGAGKSTTMNMMTGYTSSTCGTVRVNGYDILEQPGKAKEKIGYLPEIPPLYHDMTVWDYLNFVYDLKKCAKKPNICNREAHIAEVCSVVRIEEVYHRLIKNLSKGYKQRVGIAQALIGNPDILIFDEPTAGLDPREIVQIRSLIKSLGDRRTVIVSSHVLSEIQSTCQRVIVINQGYVVLDSSVADISAAMGANTRYGLRIAAPEGADVVGVLGSLPGIADIRYTGSTERGTGDYIVTARKGEDIRKALFEACAGRSWYILMITPLGMSLEDMFLTLVDSDAEAKAMTPGTDAGGHEEKETSEESPEKDDAVISAEARDEFPGTEPQTGADGAGNREEEDQ